MTEDIWYDSAQGDDGIWTYDRVDRHIKKNIKINKKVRLLRYLGNDTDNRRALEYALETDNAEMVNYLVGLASDEKYRLSCQLYYRLVLYPTRNKNYALVDLMIDTGAKYDRPEEEEAEYDYISGYRCFDPLHESVKWAKKNKEYDLLAYLKNKNCVFRKEVCSGVRKRRNELADTCNVDCDPGVNNALAHAIDKGDLTMLKQVFGRYEKCNPSAIPVAKEAMLTYINYNLPGFNCGEIMDFLTSP